MNKITLAPISYVGHGALSALEGELERLQAKKIILISDPFLAESGITKSIVDPLEKVGLAVTIYTKVEAESPIVIGENLIHYMRQEEFDLVIGLGGGSALDLAKVAAVLVENEGNVGDYLNLTGTKTITKRGLPKIMISTTSGTGSEVTNLAVFSLESSKDVITHDYLMADIAIVDPALTLSVPPKVTAATGIDALTHAIEAYVSVNASVITDPLALQAIRLITGSLRTVVKEGGNFRARTDMSYGSYIAGLAFFNAGAAAVHALAYPIGGKFHVAHGDSNAVLLPYVMSYIRASCISQMKDIYEAMGGDISNLSDEEASIQCVRALQEIVSDVGIPITLKGFGISENDLRDLATDGVKQKRLLARSPMVLDYDDIFAIYESAFKGIPIEA